MRPEIHPKYSEIKATCSCGNIILIRSTLAEDINLEVCSSCHPFYTGKQKLVDTGGRVEKFEKRFGKKSKSKQKEDLKIETQEINKPEQENLVTKEEPEVEKKEASTKKTSSKKEASTKKTSSKKETSA